MIKKITLIISLLFFLFGANIFAHSPLDASTPKTGVTTNADAQISTENVTNKAATKQVAVEKETKLEEPAMMNYIIPGTVGIIIIIGFVCYWLIFRRKQSY